MINKKQKVPKIHKKKKKQPQKKEKYEHRIPPPPLRDITLQQTLGNMEVQRLFKANEILTKLFVNQPGDIYEQEADRIAQQIVTMGDKEVQLETSETKIQKKGTYLGGDSVSSQTEAKITSLKGKGQPLEPKIRDYFQPRFGVDLKDVRVHTDSNADRLARAIRARAFTLGNDVVFAKGEYRPETHEGKKLVAHELTHAIQQSEGMQKNIVQRRRKVEREIEDGEIEIVYLPENTHEYADDLIEKMRKNYENGMRNPSILINMGIKTIIHLRIYDMWDVLKYIHDRQDKDEYKPFSSFLFDEQCLDIKSGFNNYEQEKIVACYQLILNKDLYYYYYFDFLEKMRTETLVMLSNASRIMINELNIYEENDEKLTELSLHIKYRYKKEFDETDRTRAGILTKFCKDEKVKKNLDTNTALYLDSYYSFFHNAIIYIEKNTLTEFLKDYSTQYIHGAMARFIRLFKVFEDSKAIEYVNTYYPEILQSAEDDLKTTDKLREEKVAEFPFLADVKTDFAVLSRKEISKIKTYIKDTIKERIDNIQYTKDILSNVEYEGYNRIWELGPLISYFMDKYNISETSPQGKAIKRRIEKHKNMTVMFAGKIFTGEVIGQRMVEVRI